MLVYELDGRTFHIRVERFDFDAQVRRLPVLLPVSLGYLCRSLDMQDNPHHERNQQQRPSGDCRYRPHRPIRSLRRRLFQDRIFSHQQ